MFAEIAEKKDDSKKFYEQVGTCIKLGAHEESTNRAKLAELLRYQTSELGDEIISFKKYVVRVKIGWVTSITSQVIANLLPARTTLRSPTDSGITPSTASSCRL